MLASSQSISEKVCGLNGCDIGETVIGASLIFAAAFVICMVLWMMFKD